MYPEPEKIVADLACEDPERIVTAIADLKDCWKWTFEPRVPRLQLRRILSLIGSGLTHKTTDQLTDLIGDYQHFEPPYSDRERAEALVELVLFGEDDSPPFCVNLFAKSHPELLPELLRVLKDKLPSGGGDALLGHQQLFSYLLNAKPDFRAQVVTALGDPAFAEVRAWLKPELEEDEWASMEIAKSSGA